MLRWLLVCAFIGAAGAAGYFGYVEFEHRRHAAKPAASAPKPVEVSYVEAAPEDLAVTMQFVAQTQSSQSVQINARVEGFLDSRKYVEGQLVRSGDVLFQMDPKPFEVALQQAEAAVRAQEAALTVAQETLARIEPLAAANAVSKKDLDDARGAVDRALANVDEAKAGVAQAELNLSYTTIRSPVTGMADKALQQDGTYISFSNSALTTVSLVSPMWVNFSVSEYQLTDWRRETQQGTLKPPANGEFSFKLLLPDGSPFPNGGVVTFEAPSFDATTGTFQVRGTFENPDGVMKPYQYVTALVSGFVRPDAIVVPQRAVHQSQTGHFVWVIDASNKSQLRPVEVGEWQGTGWIISKGLAKGDKVVVDGLIMQPNTVVDPKPMTKDSSAGTESQGN